MKSWETKVRGGGEIVISGLILFIILGAVLIYYIYRQVTEPGPDIFPANFRHKKDFRGAAIDVTQIFEEEELIPEDNGRR